MDADEQRALYLRGIALFNAGDYFEAHEVWEDLWRDAHGAERLFYQGLIQCAVALEHQRRGNPRGAASLGRTYPRKFEGLPRIFMGLEIARCLTGMQNALARPGAAPPVLTLIDETNPTP